MCSACEFGDPEPTLAELEASRRSIYSRAANIVNESCSKQNFWLWLILSGQKWREAASHLESLEYQIEEVRLWSTDPHDREWIYRRHDALVEAWHRQSREDQLDSLPSYVLDGPY